MQNARDVVAALGGSLTSVHKLLADLTVMDLLREFTGYKHNQMFVFRNI